MAGDKQENRHDPCSPEAYSLRERTGINWLITDRWQVLGFPGASVVKNLSAMQDTWVWSLDQEDPLEKEMAIHPSILAQKIPWTEEPGGLQTMGLQRFRQDFMIKQQQVTSVTMVGVWVYVLHESEMGVRPGF